MKLICWNVNGLRSVYQKGLGRFVTSHKPDILCLQETKIGRTQLDQTPDIGDKYQALFSGAEKKGYSGVATYVRQSTPFRPKKTESGINRAEFDREGRFLITDHRDIVLYNIYFPSGTTGDVRQDFKYAFLSRFYDHLRALPKSRLKKTVICGDFNICHKEIDIHHPQVAEKRELSGFLPDERRWMDEFAALGFVDTFRLVQGDVSGQYSWWSYRAGARQKNLGWRIDYFFVAQALAKRVKDARILGSVAGSDHCPILLELD